MSRPRREAAERANRLFGEDDFQISSDASQVVDSLSSDIEEETSSDFEENSSSDFEDVSSDYEEDTGPDEEFSDEAMLAAESDSQDDDDSGEDLFDEDDDGADVDDSATDEEENLAIEEVAEANVEAAEARVAEVAPEGATSDEVEIIRVERQPMPAPVVPQVSVHEDVGSDDFQTPKKRRKLRHDDGKEEEEKKPAEADLNDSQEMSDACPICFEPWTNSGDHRLSSLKCGHLFGYGCVTRWLIGPGRACPQCNTPAKKKDVRIIYAKRLQTIDTAELERLRGEVQKERHLRLTAEKEAASFRLQAALVTEECSRTKRSLEALRKSILTGHAAGEAAFEMATNSQKSGPLAANYQPVATVRLPDGACRVMTPCDYMNLLCVAQTSPNPLFRGFGVRRLHLLDHHMERFLMLHSQTIRDLALHPDMQDGLLLSVSMDKTAKLTSLLTGQVVHTYTCPLSIWSCCWHRDNQRQFFAGMSNGQVKQFDIRRTDDAVATLNLGDSMTPVCALQYASRAPERTEEACFRQGGLFVGQLDRVTFLAEQSAGSDHVDPPGSFANSLSTNASLPFAVTPGFRAQPLPLDGSLVSLAFEAKTRHLLASFRPSPSIPSRHNMRHLLCQMESRGTGLEATTTCNLVHTLTAGRSLQRMTRSRLFTGPGGHLMAASGDEESGATLIWDAAQAIRSQQLPGNGGTILDVAPFDTNSGVHGLVSLSESAVQFFTWKDT